MPLVTCFTGYLIDVDSACLPLFPRKSPVLIVSRIISMYLYSESSQPFGKAVESVLVQEESSAPIAKSHLTLAERKRREWNILAGRN